MLLVSNRESVRRGTPSPLAVVETAAASGLSFWLAWKHDSIEHIVIASALAPFLLLRVMSIFLRKSRNIYQQSLVTVLTPLLKTICTARVVFRHPVYSIKTIPHNFYENVFVLDLHISPKIIPGSDEVKQNEFDVYSFIQSLFGYVKETLQDPDHSLILKIIGLMFVSLPTFVFFISPLFIAAFTFRFAIKSTALLWLPLLWIIYWSQPGRNVLDRIKLYVKQPSTKLMLAYSIFVILGFGVKIISIFGLWRIEEAAPLGALGELARGLVGRCRELPLWQVASALTAVLTWAYFLRTKRHWLAKDTTEAWPEAWMEREYVTFQAVRTTLSLYAIACTLSIAAVTAWRLKWPHFIFFPHINFSGS
jgi:hypothetical protein